MSLCCYSFFYHAETRIQSTNTVDWNCTSRLTELFGLSAFCSRLNSFTRSQIKVEHVEWSVELSNFQSLFLVFRPWNEQVCLGNHPGLFFPFTDQTFHTVATFYALSHTVISRSSCSLLTRSPNNVSYWCLISKVYVMCPFVPLLHQENLFNKLTLLSYSLHWTKEITNVTASVCTINKRNAWGVYFQLSNAHAIIYVVRSY